MTTYARRRPVVDETKKVLIHALFRRFGPVVELDGDRLYFESGDDVHVVVSVKTTTRYLAAPPHREVTP